jgi:hypothetical protein
MDIDNHVILFDKDPILDQLTALLKEHKIKGKIVRYVCYKTYEGVIDYYHVETTKNGLIDCCLSDQCGNELFMHYQAVHRNTIEKQFRYAKVSDIILAK